MSGNVRNRLYELLPAAYRMRDADQGQPLQALLGVLESQAELIKESIDQLYDDLFIETCDEWVVPYLGDLLGARNVHPVEEGAFSQRAYVANTLAYRRRKGTAAVLEQLAHDVTGWSAKAVEFFQLLDTTQHVNHVRLSKGGTVGLRDANRLELIGGPFDPAAHTLDVRHIDKCRGRYNIPNLGLFLWRLQAYPMKGGTPYPAKQAGEGRYTFHPLGWDMPLFNCPRTETRITQLAEEVNVPCQLRRRPLYQELEALRQALVDKNTVESPYFSNEGAFRLLLPGEPKPTPGESKPIPIKPEEILICNLADWRRPPASKSYTSFDNQKTDLTIKVAVDPVLGRIAFSAGVDHDKIKVDYAYGFGGDVGGGPYGRVLPSHHNNQEDPLHLVVCSDPHKASHLAVPYYTEIADALAQCDKEGNKNKPVVIEIQDSATYKGSGDFAIDLGGNGNLIIRAANRQRPTLIGDIIVTGGGEQAELTLCGFLHKGNLHVTKGSLAKLSVVHCTIVPENNSDENRLTVDPSNNRLEITIDHSIVGPLRLPEAMAGLAVRDSVIHAPASLAIAAVEGGSRMGPRTTLERSTVLGAVNVKEMPLASETIFNDPVHVERLQVGCVRFSFVLDGSRTPRRYRCQPDLALAKRAAELGLNSACDLPPDERLLVVSRVRPSFTSVEYRRPAYVQLSLDCAEEIRTGAEDGSEMGVFSFLKQPQREANLRACLDEYLPFGLEAGIFFAT